jgi:hypothetical protein
MRAAATANGIVLTAAGLVTAALVAASASAAPTAADMHVFISAGPNVFGPPLPKGGTITVTALGFKAGMLVENGAGESATARARLQLPPGLRWGTDLPDPTESCTSTEATADCQTPPLDPNILNNRSIGWTWDVVADAPGSYVVTAEIVSTSVSDPDLSGNSTSATIVVTQPSTGGGGGSTATVAVSAVKVSPARARAGAAVMATVRVTADGAPVRPTRVKCTGAVGDTRLRGTARSRPGSASCAFRSPRAAQGKLLRGAIGFAARGRTFTRRFSVRLG